MDNKLFFLRKVDLDMFTSTSSGDLQQQFSAKVEASCSTLLSGITKPHSKAETINWDISVRVMYWLIKLHLEAAHMLNEARLNM
jgi:hypothetical protein